jgi:transposase
LDLARAGRTISSLAKEFEPTETTIRNWISQSERDAGLRNDGLTTDERVELNQLRRENRALREEREILPLVMSTAVKLSSNLSAP